MHLCCDLRKVSKIHDDPTRSRNKSREDSSTIEDEASKNKEGYATINGLSGRSQPFHLEDSREMPLIFQNLQTDEELQGVEGMLNSIR